ncbi:MAG: heme-degrading domain-containing protein [Candidatus Acidiferrales bacterium]
MGTNEDLARIVLQEQELTFAAFDFDAAWDLGSNLRAVAVTRQLPIVIDIRRFGAQPLFYVALTGSTPDNPEWVRRKSNVVARFHKSSYRVAMELKVKRSNLLERYALSVADFAEAGGSFPIHVRGAGVIGSVTVSGLPQRKDHETVVEALCLHLGKDYNALKLGEEMA